MIRIRISSDALEDLNDGFLFYEFLDRGLGDYFLSQLRADIDGLKITAGIHRQPHRHLTEGVQVGVHALIVGSKKSLRSGRKGVRYLK